MIKFEIETEGFKELDLALKVLPEKVQKKTLQKSVNKALREGMKDIKARAPRGEEPSPASQEYGPLWKNLKVRKFRRVKSHQRGARLDTGKAFWAVFYELGTARQPARPFFGPAFRGATTKILRTLRVELGKNIEKEAAKLRKGK